eukprot:jgi/Phyca11/97760/e_gw1.2.704.1
MFARGFWPKLVNVWYGLQVTHCGGKYSLERALALEQFTQKTSAARVVLLIIAPPLITLTVVLCQEAIPLQDPMAGWRVNYGFWARVAIIGAALGSLFSSLIAPWLDVPPLSQRQHIIYCACCGAALVCAGMLTAEVWVFPVPFFIISVYLPMAWVCMLLLGAVMGRRAVRRILSRRDQLRQMNNVSLLANLLCIGYPAFQVLFNRASQTIYELPVLLLLPVLKTLTKRLFAHLASHKWDIAAEEIIFTVDFFDALYLTTFIPNLTFVSLVAIVTIDLVQAGADLLELYHRTHIILLRLREAVSIRDKADSPVYLLHVVDNSGALQDALEVLFTSQILILTEYLEVIVPLLYGVFVLAMVHLPSAQYHTEMVGVTHENVHSTVSRMFLYALLELLSFLLLVGIVKRNCCIDAVYQLAFVLETHSHLILSRLILWMVFTLHVAFRVAHFGMSEGLFLL